MSLCNRVVLPVLAVLSLAFLAGCGGSGSTPVVPPPGGGFSNSNLNGTYTFAISGEDATGSFGFIAIAGTLTANGQGGITGGTLTVNDPLIGSLSGEAITSGSYNVGVDGRPAAQSGLLTLVTSQVTFVFDFVLTSSDHALITLFDPNNGTGSGTMDLASSVGQSNIDGQSYTFNLSGAQFSQATLVQTSFATVGTFTLDSNGAIGVSTTGVQDFNEDGLTVCSVNTGCTITSGSVNLASLPGKAVLASSAGTFSFDVYPIDSTHMKFVEIDSGVVMAGDVFTQASSIPTGNNVFTMAGFDSVAATPGPFTAAGILDTDGNGNIKSDSVEDINDVGAASEVGSAGGGSAITGSYAPVSGTRSVLLLSGFANGTNGGLCSGCEFAVYPSSGGLQLLEIDDGGMTVGVAYAQSASALASPTGYGLNLSGTNSVEEDDIAQFTNNSGAFSQGHVDFNDDAATSFNNTFTSTYSADSNVAGRGTVTAGTNGFNLTAYTVSPTTVVFVETDTNQVALGSLVTQAASGASSSAAVRHFNVMRILSNSKSKLKRRKQ